MATRRLASQQIPVAALARDAHDPDAPPRAAGPDGVMRHAAYQSVRRKLSALRAVSGRVGAGPDRLGPDRPTLDRAEHPKAGIRILLEHSNKTAAAEVTRWSGICPCAGSATKT